MSTTVGRLVLDPGGAAGALVSQPGEVQYGAMMFGAAGAGWFELVGWRDTPDTSVSDTTRPQAHGAYPGDIWAEAQTITYTYRLPDVRLLPTDVRLAMLRALEGNLPLDAVDRALVVNDGDGPTLRMARVLQRRIPQPWDFLKSRSLDVSVQWLCADPRRYSLAQVTVTAVLGTSVGGLVYPLAYPLAYGTSTGGSRIVTNDGNTPAPLQAVFTGPLTNPVLASTQGWRLGFRITLAAGETLVVDTGAGTVLLNGDTDRLYVVDSVSSPLERCQLPPGPSTIGLSASAGTGQVGITYRHAYL